ncbi:unnamed protein product [Prorocentrum cordatum]|uniref:WW domain-containing protein n=1 Tax=Prorocentrum cordatum TaxID=2364126 RepID=A0ABN9SQL7_9DINO|nr:unnamed protein product [Polarella glacialis]
MAGWALEHNEFALAACIPGGFHLCLRTGEIHGLNRALVQLCCSACAAGSWVLGAASWSSAELLLLGRQRSERVHPEDKTASGKYAPSGSNHGRPCFTKRAQREGQLVDEHEVHLYYWRQDDDPDMSGWWFGQEVGGETVWARHESCAHLPPKRGWTVVNGGQTDLEMSVEDAGAGRRSPLQPRAQPAPPAMSPRARSPTPAQGSQPRRGREDDLSREAGPPAKKNQQKDEPGVVDGCPCRFNLPHPWVPVRYGSSSSTFYYWNKETQESTWDLPPGRHPRPPPSRALKGSGDALEGYPWAVFDPTLRKMKEQLQPKCVAHLLVGSTAKFAKTSKNFAVNFATSDLATEFKYWFVGQDMNRKFESTLKIGATGFRNEFVIRSESDHFVLAKIDSLPRLQLTPNAGPALLGDHHGAHAKVDRRLPRLTSDATSFIYAKPRGPCSQRHLRVYGAVLCGLWGTGHLFACECEFALFKYCVIILALALYIL